MAEFTVTSKQLYDKAAELERANNQLKQKIDFLRQQDQALSKMWEGDAHDAFKSSFAKDAQKMDNFYKGIQKYVTALRDIAQKYEIAESRNKATASSN